MDLNTYYTLDSYNFADLQNSYVDELDVIRQEEEFHTFMTSFECLNDRYTTKNIDYLNYSDITYSSYVEVDKDYSRNSFIIYYGDNIHYDEDDGWYFTIGSILHALFVTEIPITYNKYLELVVDYSNSIDKDYDYIEVYINGDPNIDNISINHLLQNITIRFKVGMADSLGFDANIKVDDIDAHYLYVFRDINGNVSNIISFFITQY